MRSKVLAGMAFGMLAVVLTGAQSQPVTRAGGTGGKCTGR